MDEKRLIDANALADRFRIERESSTPNDQYEIGFLNGLTMAQSVVLSAPTVDAVEVVRCKDCKHLVLTDKGEHNPNDCVCDYWMTDGLNDNDFCYYGERRTDV